MSEIDILMDELLKDVEVNVAEEPKVMLKGLKNQRSFWGNDSTQEVPQTKPVSLGLSIRKDIFMSPKKEVIELGVRK